MRIERARLAGAFVAAAPLVGGAIAAAWVRLELPLPICVFHAWTGLPCVTCGSTRMLRAALSGRVLEALSWNPLVFCALSVVVPWIAVSGMRLFAGRPVPHIALSSRARAQLALVAAAAVLANWVYLVLRGI